VAKVTRALLVIELERSIERARWALSRANIAVADSGVADVAKHKAYSDLAKYDAAHPDEVPE